MNRMREVKSLILTQGENPHILEVNDTSETIKILHFGAETTLGNAIHRYVTPKGGCMIRHDVPLAPNGRGEREPHSPVEVEGEEV
jgi:hypothetical protein